MPVFFLISGMLYKIKDPLEDIQNIKRTLIMPYIYIALLTTIIGLVLFGYWQDWKFVCKCILGVVSGNDLHVYGILPFSGPLWFLYALILVRLIMCVLIRADLVKWGGYLICIIGVIIMYMGDRLPCKIDSALVGWIYFYTGYQIKNQVQKIDEWPVVIKLCSFIISMIICCLTILLIDDIRSEQVLSLNVVYFGNYPLCFLVGSFVGCFGMLLLGSCLSITKSRYVLINSNGMIITLGFHQVIYMLYCHLVEPSYSIITALAASLIVYGICYLLIIICYKKCPVLLGNRKIE